MTPQTPPAPPSKRFPSSETKSELRIKFQKYYIIKNVEIDVFEHGKNRVRINYIGTIFISSLILKFRQQFHVLYIDKSLTTI